MLEYTHCTTLGELKETGYQTRSIKEEIRHNLIDKISNNQPVFDGILGYENTVIPEVENALLAGHNINLLGLRGQAKTRIARQLVSLLDEYVPIIKGSGLNDDPFRPISSYGKQQVKNAGDKTEITWLHRDERYVEKLATPDVSVADLIGDVDPIKAINRKLEYDNEEVIHYGIIPRSNRCIFVINEIPDLQPRIQVALFNILQEGDVQIRGFKMRLPMDVQFIFTANPEDYTNRGAIITPLKDRLGSQILTHYPSDLAIAKNITKQEARIFEPQKKVVRFRELIAHLIERVVLEARDSEYVDEKSGVSARLGISAMELVHSAVERRVLKNGEKQSMVRISDLYSIVPAMTGKMEMVYEGEQEGPRNVAYLLIGRAIRKEFALHFPAFERKVVADGQHQPNEYDDILNWFESGNKVSTFFSLTDKAYARELNKVDGLAALVKDHVSDLKGDEVYLWMEFILHGLAEYSKLGKKFMESGPEFSDLLGSVFSE